jgi:serine/threonine protein kinase/Tfp pilus assembly protein PilF
LIINMPLEASPGADVCSTCHRPLTQSGSDGECVRCLFAIALSPDEYESAQDASGSKPPIAEAHRYGQFDILTAEDGSFQELGAGAMGITYRARDSVLDRVVALKVIERRFAADPVSRARFLREARAAARLRHPNVASVHHYGEQDGQCFYAMELIEGETLEARVRGHGPLPAALALEIAMQVTRALVAAEAQGIVHRDLKPSNIMLVTGGSGNSDAASVIVKVIDFGLAKAVAADTPTLGLADTRGGFVGTPAFASPEQYARVAAERVDTRSDIYSLGVTLWYLLCGKLPFVGRTLTEIHEQQVAQPLPMAQLKGRRVPESLASLLKSMLAVAPTARPQSARELLGALQRCQKRIVVSPQTRLARFAATAGPVALAFLGLLLWHEHIRQRVPPPDRSLAVLPFENLSADPQKAYFAAGIQDEVSANLAQIADLKVTSPRSTKNFPNAKRNLSAIGRELGVTHLLEGSARRANDRLDIKLNLIDLRQPEHRWTKEYDRPIADVFAVPGEISRAVADQLEATVTPLEKASIDQAPTRDLTAYDLFLRVREAPQLFVGDGARESARKCIALLEQAVARDPTFARAYCQLATEHDYLWNHPSDSDPPEVRAVDHRALAEGALRKARSLDPDSGTLHRVMAFHLYCAHDLEQAAAEADLSCRLLPNDSVAAFYAGIISLQSSHWNNAVRYLERAVALDPLNMINLCMLGDTYSYLRRDDAADRTYETLLDHLPASDKGGMILLYALRKVGSRGDLAPLRAALAGLSQSNDPDGSDRLKHGVILRLFEGDANGADRVLAAGKDSEFEDSGFTYPKPWFAALAANLRHDHAAAQAAFAAARPIMEKSVANKPDSGMRLSYLAMIDAGLGRKEDAVREGLRACELCPYETHAVNAPAVRCSMAVVYAWTGQPDLAFAELGNAVDRPAGDAVVLQPTYGDLRLNPVWDALRSDPRFDVLIRKLAPPEKAN